MSTPVRPRPLPQSFDTWLSLSSDAEVLALLRLVVEAAERRGFVPAVTWSRRSPKRRLAFASKGPGTTTRPSFRLGSHSIKVDVEPRRLDLFGQ